MDGAGGYVAGRSKIILDLSVTTGTDPVSIESEGELLTIAGVITNAGEDKWVVGWGGESPASPGQRRDMDLVVHATIMATGNGRRGVQVEDNFGRGISVSNRGSITTTGDVHIRNPVERLTVRRAYGLKVHQEGSADGGSIKVVNEKAATISTAGRAADGISVSKYTSGEIAVDNQGTVSASGNNHEHTWTFEGETRREARDADGIGVSHEGEAGDTVITNSGTVAASGTGGRGITATSESSGNVRVSNSGTVTTEGGAWESSFEDFNRRAYGVFAQNVGGGDATAVNEVGGVISTGLETPTGSGLARSGTQAHGLRASKSENAIAGSSEAINRGTITTRGERAHGMSTWVQLGDGSEQIDPSKLHTTRGRNSGTITTHGHGANAMQIISSTSTNTSSTVLASNERGGTITVGGENADGILALFWHEDSQDSNALGTITATNDGTINVMGSDRKDSAFDRFMPSGIYAAFVSAASAGTILNSGDVEVYNRGQINASGSRAVGINALAHGTGDIRIAVENGRIVAGQKEVAAQPAVAADPNATPPVEAKPAVEAKLRRFGIGIRAEAKTDSTTNSQTEETDPSDDDDIEVEVSGSSTQIDAYGAPSDDGGTTDHDESKGIAIWLAAGPDGHSKVSLSERATVNAYGTTDEQRGIAVLFSQGTGTLDIDNANVSGDIMFAQPGSAGGENRLDITNGRLSGNITFASGNFADRLTVRDSSWTSINGDIDFGDGEDEFSIRVQPEGFVGINGGIDFGAGSDKFNIEVGREAFVNIRSGNNRPIDFNSGNQDELDINVGQDGFVNIDSEIIGLHTLKVDGHASGTVRIRKGVTFSGSSLQVENGRLIVDGIIELGTSGEVTIKQPARLVFTYGPDGTGGQINGGSVHFAEPDDEQVNVYVALRDDFENDQQRQATVDELVDKTRIHTIFYDTRLTYGDDKNDLKSLNVMSEGTDEKLGNAMVAESTNIATIEYDPLATDESDAKVYSGFQTVKGDRNEDVPEAQGNRPAGSQGPVAGSTGSGSGGSGGGGSGGGAVLGLGLLAVLVGNFFGDDAGAGFYDYSVHAPQQVHVASVDEHGLLTVSEISDQPYRLWLRPVSSHLSGIGDAGASGTQFGLAAQSGQYFFSASMTPDSTGSVDALDLASNGTAYSLSSGWRNDRHFFALSASQGDYEVDSVLDNPVVSSVLLSSSQVSTRQIRASAGTNWEAGRWHFAPTASLHRGTINQSAHIAQGYALEASVPSYSQDYSAAGLGISASATDWLDAAGSLRWKPRLRLDSIRTSSQKVDGLTLRQTDRLGALSFSTAAAVRGLPETVNSLSFGATVKTAASRGTWKMGYAGLEADGELHQVAIAGYSLKF